MVETPRNLWERQRRVRHLFPYGMNPGGQSAPILRSSHQPRARQRIENHTAQSTQFSVCSKGDIIQHKYMRPKNSEVKHTGFYKTCINDFPKPKSKAFPYLPLHPTEVISNNGVPPWPGRVRTPNPPLIPQDHCDSCADGYTPIT